jgi:predicted extracellular nuclease
VPVTDADKEQYEGMLVQPQGTYTITNNYGLNQYGQVGLAVGEQPLYTATDVVLPGAAATAYELENTKKYITLDDGSSWDYLRSATAQDSPLPYLSQDEPMRTGSQLSFTKPVILDYRFQWNYQPTGQVVGPTDADDPVTTENDREFTAPAVGGNLKLATFNVLNYFPDLGATEDTYKDCPSYDDRDGNPVTTNFCEVRGAWTAEAFGDQETKIVTAINGLGADVISLEEIENSAAISYLPGQPRDKALATLVTALNADGGQWAYVASPTVTPSNEDVIRTAFIYRKDRVMPLEASQILLDGAFANARYPLAQKFKALNAGSPFVVIANHFKSKGSGVNDGTGQGNANPSRVAQATALTTWANTQFADEAVFLVGDFNAYSREDPIRIIEAAGYTNLAKKFDEGSASYQFDGRLGSLDHGFANAKALKMVTGAGVWDINGDESVAMQYSRRNYNVTDFFAATPFSSSDHDPLLIGLRVNGRGPR